MEVLRRGGGREKVGLGCSLLRRSVQTAAGAQGGDEPAAGRAMRGLWRAHGRHFWSEIGLKPWHFLVGYTFCIHRLYSSRHSFFSFFGILLVDLLSKYTICTPEACELWMLSMDAGWVPLASMSDEPWEDGNSSGSLRVLLVT